MRRSLAGAAAALAAAAFATGAVAQPVAAGGPPAPLATAPAPTASPPRAQPVAAPAREAPASAEEAPLLLWGALGASALALLLGGGALVVALGRRAEPAPADLTFTPAPDRRLTERVERLETALRELQAPPGSAGARVSTPSVRADAFPPRSSPGIAAADARAGSSSLRGFAEEGGAPDRPEALDPWLATVTTAFARLARDPSAEGPAFISRHRPRGAAIEVDGIILLDGFERAKLWAAPAPGAALAGDEVWALVPGEEAAVNWSAHFATRRTEVAAEVFGPAFDLEAGGGEALRMEAPAVLARDPATGRLRVRQRGRLAGFRG